MKKRATSKTGRKQRKKKKKKEKNRPVKIIVSFTKEAEKRKWKNQIESSMCSAWRCEPWWLLCHPASPKLNEFRSKRSTSYTMFIGGSSYEAMLGNESYKVSQCGVCVGLQLITLSCNQRWMQPRGQPSRKYQKRLRNHVGGRPPRARFDLDNRVSVVEILSCSVHANLAATQLAKNRQNFENGTEHLRYLLRRNLQTDPKNAGTYGILPYIILHKSEIW